MVSKNLPEQYQNCNPRQMIYIYVIMNYEHSLYDQHDQSGS